MNFRSSGEYEAQTEPTTSAIPYGQFEYGLTENEELRARRLHRDSVVVDMTFQGPFSPDVWTPELRRELELAMQGPADYATARTFLVGQAIRTGAPPYKELFDESGVTSAPIGCPLTDEKSLRAAAGNMRDLLGAFPWLRQTTSVESIRSAHVRGEHALWGMCQVNLLEPGSLGLLDLARELEILAVVDCAYNVATHIGSGCTEAHDSGLTDFGRQFVSRCNEVGIAIDTAHSGPATTMDACRVSRFPVLATHTAASALYSHDRNKSDLEIRAIASTGGVVGVVAVPAFLGPPSESKLSIERMLDHIDYISDLVGWQHVGIGTDWPLDAPHDVLVSAVMPVLKARGIRDEHNLDLTETLVGFRDSRDMVNITRGLVAREYSDQQIRGILGENFLRVLEAVRA